jgi:DHA2 family methylenomycin A resistance protein-like MFS transporter
MKQIISNTSLTLVAASLGFVVVQLDVTIVNVALQRLGASFNSNITSLQWVVDAYTIVFASLIPAAGALGDRIGARRVFVAGFTVFTLGSIGCAAASGISALIAARAVQGIGAAALVPCSLALLNHTFHDEAARAKAVAVWAAGASVALAAGPVVGGMLIASIGWRSIFLVNLPLGVAGIWLTLRHTAETACSTRRGLDLAGQCAIIISLATLAAAAIEGGRLGFDHQLVLAATAIFIFAAVAFVAIEARGSAPMLPLAFFRNANFSAALLVGLLINITYYGLIFLFSLLFQRAKGYPPLLAGAAFVPMTAGVLVTNLAAGRATARYGACPPMIAGLALFLIGCLCLLPITQQTPFSHMWWQLLLMGAGVGLVVPPMTTAVLGAVERHQSGITSGALNATRQTGSVIGVALFGALVAGDGDFTAGMRIALWLSIGLLLAGTAACLRYVASNTYFRPSAVPHPSSASGA